MDKRSWVLLIVGILLIAMFMVSWLVFKNIRIVDWIALILGVSDIIMLVVRLKKVKGI